MKQQYAIVEDFTYTEVHRVGCGDLRRKPRHAYQQQVRLESYEFLDDLVQTVWGEILDEDDLEQGLDQVRVFPCCKLARRQQLKRSK